MSYRFKELCFSFADAACKILGYAAPDAHIEGAFIQTSDLILDPRQNKRIQGLEQKLHAAEEVATTDTLTGLPNRRAVEKALIRMLKLALRENPPHHFMVAILDADHFKKVNDTYGHPVGDGVLKHIANHASEELRRATEFVGRLGGEEFLAVMLVKSPQDGLKRLEQVRQRLDNELYQSGEIKIAQKISVGAAHIDAALVVDKIKRIHAKYSDQVQQQHKVTDRYLKWVSSLVTTSADKALYGAKEGGRNRVTLAEPLYPEKPTGKTIPVQPISQSSYCVT